VMTIVIDFGNILYWVAVVLLAMYVLCIPLMIIDGLMAVAGARKDARRRAESDARIQRTNDWLAGRGPMPPEEKLRRRPEPSPEPPPVPVAPKWTFEDEMYEWGKGLAYIKQRWVRP
jgi:hypothetical protein